ncbi:hypothetical protein ACQB60_35630 [Actinomycetota bacterium Odt1-20B]
MMTTAATPDTAVRAALRAAGGRRGLQVVLLLAGLLALGFLFGERAQAAESGPVPVDAPLRAAVEAPKPVEPTDPVKPVEATDPVDAAQPVEAAKPVVRQVERPARTAVHEVVDRVGGIADAGSPKLPLPDAGLPDAGLPDVGLPGDDSGRAPEGRSPETGPARHQGQGHGPGQDQDRRKDQQERHASGAPFGPRADFSYGNGLGPTADRGDERSDRRADEGLRGPAGGLPHAPLPRVPGEGLANQSVGDTSSPRHGDLHAAAFGDRAAVLLASGPVRASEGAPTRDRHRDIPEFPG